MVDNSMMKMFITLAGQMGDMFLILLHTFRENTITHF